MNLGNKKGGTNTTSPEAQDSNGAYKRPSTNKPESEEPPKEKNYSPEDEKM